jgi:hypothetical protein
MPKMNLSEDTVSKFQFHYRWKEELVCSCPEGTFTLELTIGFATVYLPTEETWQKIAPDWAKGEWATLHKDIQLWCVNNSIPLVIDSNAHLI